jgi:hypothetical protein
MWFYENVSILIPLCEAVVTLFVIANFSLATFMDAGVIPKGKFDNILLQHLSNVL